jgi:hypothetical protein
MTYACLQQHSRNYLPLASCLVWAMVAGTAAAEMTIITLSQLVKKSEVIIFGHIKPSAMGMSNESPAVVQFEAQSILKGKDAAEAGIFPLCNLRDHDDRDDLSRLTGDSILFVSRRGQCFDLSHGYRSVIAVKDGRAVTITIEDQPEVQSLQDFLGQIRALVRAAAPTAHPVPADDKQSQFVQLASDAAKAHDAKAFGSLYCDSSKQKPKPAAAIFRFFSHAYSKAPRLDKGLPEVFSLFICFESVESKEMCQVFSVSQIGERLCILDDGKA